MHYRVLTNIVIQQIPSVEFPYRDMTITIPSLVDYEGESTWGNLTQTMHLTLPKNLRVLATSVSRPSMNRWIYLGNISSANANIGGFTPDQVPTLLRGDRITMNVGWRGNPGGKEQTIMSGTDLSATGGLRIPPLFKGFISKVTPKLPFKIECEDNMWLLKQIPTPGKQWGKQSIQSIISTILNDSQGLDVIQRYNQYGGVNIKVSEFSTTELTFNVYNFITQRGGSIADLLQRIKHQYRIDSYFREDELRVGALHYVPADRVNHNFAFQKNILSDSLTWRRRDDIRLSMLVNSHYEVEREGTNADGTKKTVRKSTQILVYYDNSKKDWAYTTKEKGVDLPVSNGNVAGEVHNLNINSDISDPQQLFELAKPRIQNYYYTGFRGSFVTYGIPFVKHGDTVTLTNNILPEFNGTYMVKKVTSFGGSQTGLRQRIEIDYLIT